MGEKSLLCFKLTMTAFDIGFTKGDFLALFKLTMISFDMGFTKGECTAMF